MRPTWGSLAEPHRKQNLYANPKRPAKFYLPCIRRNPHKKGSNFLKIFPSRREIFRETDRRTQAKISKNLFFSALHFNVKFL